MFIKSGNDFSLNVTDDLPFLNANAVQKASERVDAILDGHGLSIPALNKLADEVHESILLASITGDDVKDFLEKIPEIDSLLPKVESL